MTEDTDWIMGNRGGYRKRRNWGGARVTFFIQIHIVSSKHQKFEHRNFIFFAEPVRLFIIIINICTNCMKKKQCTKDIQ